MTYSRDRFDVIERLVEKALKKVEEYFSAPQVMVEFVQIIDDPRTDVDRLTKVVESDLSLSLSLLRLVNSSAFGLRQSVTSVHQAIMYLGFNEVKNLFMAKLVRSQLLRQSPEDELLSRKGVWQHSVATAVLSRILSQKSKVGNPDTVYIAGLLHDVGWIAIEIGLPEATRAVLRAAEEEQAWPEGHELRYLGFSHEDAGAWLLQKWDLPAIFRRLVLHHHEPLEAGEHSSSAAVIHLADIIGSRSFPFFPKIPVPDEPVERLWRSVDLTPQVQDSVMEEFMTELTRLEVLLRF